MNKEKARKAMDEIMVLYKSNKLEAIAKIRDNKEETRERRAAAYIILQAPEDPRRYY